MPGRQQLEPAINDRQGVGLMIVHISYTDAIGKHHDMEWVCQTGYTVDQAIECFGNRYPTATLHSCTRIDAPCLR